MLKNGIKLWILACIPQRSYQICSSSEADDDRNHRNMRNSYLFIRKVVILEIKLIMIFFNILGFHQHFSYYIFYNTIYIITTHRIRVYCLFSLSPSIDGHFLGSYI